MLLFPKFSKKFEYIIWYVNKACCDFAICWYSRCICLLDHPVPNTKDALSTQIIIPQKQVNRKSDIYVTMVSYTHQVASKNWFVAMVSTNVETDNPEHEIQPGVALLGPVKQKFLQVPLLIYMK